MNKRIQTDERSKRAHKKLISRHRLISTLYIPLSLFYMELMTRAFTFGSVKAGQIKVCALLSSILMCGGATLIFMQFASGKKKKGIKANPILFAVSGIAVIVGLAVMIGRISFLQMLLNLIFSVAVGFGLSRIGSDLISTSGVFFWLIASSTVSALIFGGMTVGQFLSIALFSLSWGAVETLILTAFSYKKAIRFVAPIMLFATTVIFCIQRVVYSAFSSYFGLDAAGAANNLGDFASQAFTAILKSLPSMLFLFLPTALMIAAFARCRALPKRNAHSRFTLAVMACAPFIIMSFVIGTSKGHDGLLNLYNHPEINETAKNFGVLTSARLELDTVLFGSKKVDLGEAINPGDIDNPFDTKKSDDTTAETDPSEETKPEDKPKEYGYNITDIDFDSLIAKEEEAVKNAKTEKDKELHETILSMHKYYSALDATKKNEYTGMFEGKNLIFMTLEGFSGKVIDPELTPILYKMSTQGFVFNNFYCSMWGGSTATGEYANITGQFYNSASCLEMSASNYMPNALGNMFKNAGYKSYAFHGNTAEYYHRDLSHPNMGFEYIARGTGVENLTDRNGNKMAICWPGSDMELADVTADLYMEEQPFLAYYMTLSGHGYYSWSGNKMSARHQDEVGNVEGSEEVKAYYAAQLEVEGMMRNLIGYLTEAGILEDTVFVLSCDHYPYMMGDDSLAALYKLPQEGILKNYDLYRNTLFIWSACMEEPVIVDTPCSSIDILPTVYNLFGIEYDSRLFAGTDIMSDTDPLVIMNGVSGPYWGFINKYGSYSTNDGFIAAPGYEADAASIKSYVKQMRAMVNNKKNYTFYILENDYFSYLYGLK